MGTCPNGCICTPTKTTSSWAPIRWDLLSDEVSCVWGTSISFPVPVAPKTGFISSGFGERECEFVIWECWPANSLSQLQLGGKWKALWSWKQSGSFLGWLSIGEVVVCWRECWFDWKGWFWVMGGLFRRGAGRGFGVDLVSVAFARSLVVLKCHRQHYQELDSSYYLL